MTNTLAPLPAPLALPLSYNPGVYFRLSLEIIILVKYPQWLETGPIDNMPFLLMLKGKSVLWSAFNIPFTAELDW